MNELPDASLLGTAGLGKKVAKYYFGNEKYAKSRRIGFRYASHNASTCWGVPTWKEAEEVFRFSE